MVQCGDEEAPINGVSRQVRKTDSGSFHVRPCACVCPVQFNRMSCAVMRLRARVPSAMLAPRAWRSRRCTELML